MHALLATVLLHVDKGGSIPMVHGAPMAESGFNSYMIIQSCNVKIRQKRVCCPREHSSEAKKRGRCEHLGS